LDEAIERCRLFRELGADWTFLEAPESVEEMREYCSRVSGPKLANMLEGGKTPILPPKDLEAMGYTVAAYPLTLLSSATRAYQDALRLLKKGDDPEKLLVPFKEVQRVVGFDEYYRTLEEFGKE
jgi:2-methylisocitrate lyase-like PEP mutase family enzyme